MGSYSGIYQGEGEISGTDALRDSWELKLFNQAFKKRLPVLGICRGHQLINAALNGKLYRDIYSFKCDLLEHRNDTLHEVSISFGSKLYSMLGASTNVLSWHHQAVAVPGTGLTVTAKSEDGIIEATEHATECILSVQWHPERMGMIEPFRWLNQNAILYSQ